MFEALVSWVEQGKAPEKILASKTSAGVTQTRPLCPYPAFARWNGQGSTDDAANFVCRVSFGQDSPNGDEADWPGFGDRD
jgi:feruloyl esterase